MITWPALLKLTGDDELLFVESQHAWESDADLHSAAYQPEDILIDSSGAIFDLYPRKASSSELVASPKGISLESAIELIKLHQSQLGACCAAKLYFPSIADAVLSLKDPA